MATSVQPKDKTVNVNGINLHYLDWGNEGKPKVLLLDDLLWVGLSYKLPSGLNLLTEFQVTNQLLLDTILHLPLAL